MISPSNPVSLRKTWSRGFALYHRGYVRRVRSINHSVLAVCNLSTMIFFSLTRRWSSHFFMRWLRGLKLFWTPMALEWRVSTLRCLLHVEFHLMVIIDYSTDDTQAKNTFFGWSQHWLTFFRLSWFIQACQKHLLSFSMPTLAVMTIFYFTSGIKLTYGRQSTTSDFYKVWLRVLSAHQLAPLFSSC